MLCKSLLQGWGQCKEGYLCDTLFNKCKNSFSFLSFSGSKHLLFISKAQSQAELEQRKEREGEKERKREKDGKKEKDQECFWKERDWSWQDSQHSNPCVFYRMGHAVHDKQIQANKDSSEQDLLSRWTSDTHRPTLTFWNTSWSSCRDGRTARWPLMLPALR